VVLFAFVWAQTQLFHLLKDWHQWTDGVSFGAALANVARDACGPHTWLVLAICWLAGSLFIRGLAVIYSDALSAPFPPTRSLRPLVLLAAASVTYLLLYGSQSNHILIDVFLNASIVLAGAPALLRGHKDQAFPVIVTVLRVQTVCLYGIATLHKLNAAWFDPTVSCASQVMGMVMQQQLPSLFPPTAAHTRFLLMVNPYFAMVVEVLLVVAFALPISLDDPDHGRVSVLRRFKRLVATVGIGMHVYLALPLPPSSFYPFSVIMVPLYMAQIPNRLLAVAQQSTGVNVLSTAGIILLVVARCWVPFVTGSADAFYEYPPYGAYSLGVAWLALWFSAIAVALWTPLPESSTLLLDVKEPERVWPLSALALVCPVGVLVVGLMPFLGLRTYPAFAMFSNLRVEGCASNHLLLPQLAAGYTEDFVEVHDTDIPALQAFQVDLSRLYHAPTRKFLADAGLTPALWICPPNWTTPTPFQPFFLPSIALRRLLTRPGFPHTGGGVGSAAVTVYQKCQRGRHLRLKWPLSKTVDAEFASLLRPLTHWEAAVARFRAFDLHSSVCRH